ncbi:MAG: hypothetical protein QOJ12_1497 [Thermoleophilales bacterium]|jgi:microcystin-dependent protein|nr:hypothetical protein [Thermoleophilales bacterium]
MNPPYLAEIRLFPWNVVPPGWAQCDGNLLPVRGNEDLFRLIGTTFGGDGTDNFGLPDLRGRAAVRGGPALPLGRADGEETHTLTAAEMPSHTHVPQAATEEGDTSVPGGTLLASAPLYGTTGRATTLRAGTVSTAGGGEPHTNVQPFLALGYCIATRGAQPRGD